MKRPPGLRLGGEYGNESQFENATTLNFARKWYQACKPKCMILLVTSAAKAKECAAALRESTAGQVDLATTLRQASHHLRTSNYSAVVVDQLLVEAEPVEAEMLAQHMDVATPVYLNFAVCGIERIMRELRAALQRRKKEESNARRSAEQSLRNELKGPVTALLLSCEMALQSSGLPPAAELKLREVDDLARRVCSKLVGSA